VVIIPKRVVVHACLALPFIKRITYLLNIQNLVGDIIESELFLQKHIVKVSLMNEFIGVGASDIWFAGKHLYH